MGTGQWTYTTFNVLCTLLKFTFYPNFFTMYYIYHHVIHIRLTICNTGMGAKKRHLKPHQALRSCGFTYWKHIAPKMKINRNFKEIKKPVEFNLASETELSAQYR